MIVAQSELFDGNHLLSTGTGIEGIPLNEDVLKAKERAENRAMMFSGFFFKEEII